MSYQLIQAVDHGSRFLNMDQVVSIHVVAEETPGKPLDYMVCFTTASIHANYKVKFDELQDALEYVKELTGIIQEPEIEEPRSVVAGFKRLA